MKKKNLGKIYIIIGIYLFVINPIMSMVFNQVYTIGYYVQLDPLRYWFTWLWMYGWYTIILAGVGAYLINVGYRNIKRSPEN